MRKREFHADSVRSILVVRLYFMGDVVITTPVFEALRKTFPEATISVMVKKRARDVLLENPHVDEIIVYDEVENYHSPAWLARLAVRLRRRRFDLAVDLTGDHRSSLLLLIADPAFRIGLNHAGWGLGRLLDRRIPYEAPAHVADHLLSSVEAVGARLPGEATPRIYLSDAERARVRGLLVELGLGEDEPYIMIAPGASTPFRRWSPERFGSLAAAAKERLGLRSAVTGSPGEKGIADAVVASSDGTAVNLAGRTSVRELAAVAAGARAFVGNDSGPIHIAASVGTPVVGILGPTTPDVWGARGAPRRLVESDYPCRPCDQETCVRPDDPCLEAIGVEEVMRALEDLLTEERP